MNSNKTPEANPGFAGYILDETASANYMAMLYWKTPRAAGVSRMQHRHPVKTSGKVALRITPLLGSLLLTLSMTGCGWFDRSITANIKGYSESCVAGLTVLQFPSGAIYQRNSDDKLVPCR